eukprot:PhF_6_TR6259/c0_g1_i2/m.9469
MYPKLRSSWDSVGFGTITEVHYAPPEGTVTWEAEQYADEQFRGVLNSRHAERMSRMSAERNNIFRSPKRQPQTLKVEDTAPPQSSEFTWVETVLSSSTTSLSSSRMAETPDVSKGAAVRRVSFDGSQQRLPTPQYQQPQLHQSPVNVNIQWNVNAAPTQPSSTSSSSPSVQSTIEEMLSLYDNNGKRKHM